MGIEGGSLLFSASDGGARSKILLFQTILPLCFLLLFFLEPHANILGSVLSSSETPQRCLSRWVICQWLQSAFLWPCFWPISIVDFLTTTKWNYFPFCRNIVGFPPRPFEYTPPCACSLLLLFIWITSTQPSIPG